MNSKKAKLIHTAAVRVWSQKSEAYRQKWGTIAGQDKLGRNLVDTRQAFHKFYNQMKKDYLAGKFNIVR